MIAQNSGRTNCFIFLLYLKSESFAANGWNSGKRRILKPIKNIFPLCILGLLFTASFDLAAQVLTEKATAKGKEKVPAAVRTLVERSSFKDRGDYKLSS